MSDSPQTEVRRDLYLSAILSLWDRGLDTLSIAKTLSDDEARIYSALHVARDRRLMINTAKGK